MIGVDYDLFWTLNPKSLTPFNKAFSFKQKYDDMLAWHSGMYIQFAIASCLSKDNKYPSRPFMDDSVVPKTQEEQEELFKQRIAERMFIINSRFGKEVEN